MRIPKIEFKVIYAKPQTTSKNIFFIGGGGRHIDFEYVSLGQI